MTFILSCADFVSRLKIQAQTSKRTQVAESVGDNNDEFPKRAIHIIFAQDDDGFLSTFLAALFLAGNYGSLC